MQWYQGGWGLPLVSAAGPESDDGSANKRRRKSWKDIYAERMQVECNVCTGLSFFIIERQYITFPCIDRYFHSHMCTLL